MKQSKKNFALNAGGKRTAFTLAEVLITLTIIGVIAAMIIPNLLQKHFEAEMISKLKKNYSVLNNAMAQAAKDNGPMDEWLTTEGSGNALTKKNSKIAFDTLKPYLKVHKDCGQNSGCFFSGNYKALFNDTSDAGFRSIDANINGYKFMLEDGTSVRFNIRTKAQCQSDPNYCGVIYLDLNGPKGPNRFGVDLQRLHFTNKSVKPSTSDPEFINGKEGNTLRCAFNDTSASNGAYCSAHILLKGNMKYLHKSIVEDWPMPTE